MVIPFNWTRPCKSKNKAFITRMSSLASIPDGARLASRYDSLASSSGSEIKSSVLYSCFFCATFSRARALATELAVKGNLPQTVIAGGNRA